MPEHLRAMVVIVVLAGLVFLFAEKSLAPLMVDGAFKRRRNIWIAVVLVAFLSHGFWLYVLACSVLLLSRLGRDEVPLSLYCVLLFAVPALDMQVPGLGLINYVFDLNHVRLLNLVILLPVAIRLANQPEARPTHVKLPDTLLLAYLLYAFVMQAMVDSMTGIMRTTFYLLVDIWLPYFVASRSIRDLRSLQDVAASFVMGVAALCPIAVFEMLRSWLLYDGLRGALRVPGSEFALYLTRGEGGMLRSNATVGNAIVLGYVMMVGIAFFTFLLPRFKSRLVALGAAMTLGAGLVAALSRGPWVGTAVVVFVVICLGPGGGKRFVQAVGLSAVAVGVLMMTPYGKPIIDHLPFIGTVDEGNVIYRQRLFELSILVLWQNPLFGAFDYIMSPVLEEMRTGLGIIDIVNSYLAIALAYGFVGLALFVSPFVACVLSVWAARKNALDCGDLEAERFGRVLIGCVLGIMVTIATVSSIGVVPTIYWLVLGLCVAFARAFGASGALASHHAGFASDARVSRSTRNGVYS